MMASANPLHVLLPDHGIRFNAVLDRITALDDSHAAGYRRAAELLLQRFFADPDGTAGERDTLVLPILFLFRHYLELRFKDIIVYGQVLSGQQPEWRHGHELDKLWAEVLRLSDRVYGSTASADFVRVGECGADLCQLDPASTSFRDPRNASRRPVFAHVVIGLQVLNTTVASIGDFLDAMSMELSVWVQEQP